jgi:hypothetical protein
VWSVGRERKRRLMMRPTFSFDRDSQRVPRPF